MKNKIQGIAALVLSGLLVVFQSPVLRFILDLITVHFSPDNYVKPGSMMAVRIYYFIFIAILVFLGLFFLMNLSSRTGDFVTRHIETGKLRGFFLHDKLFAGTRFPLIIFITGSVSGLILLMYYLVFGRPEVEGILENTTTGFLFLSALLLFISAIRIRRKLSGPYMPGNVFILLVILSFLLLFLFGEEVSWGYHLLGFKPDNILTRISFQGETNIHNLFNPFFSLVYPVTGFLAFLIYWMLWTFGKDRDSFLFHLLMPPRSLFILIFLMACSSCAHSTEIFEEMFYLAILLHSIRLFVFSVSRTDRPLS